MTQMNPLRAIKGMNDVLPDEIGRWQHIEAEFARVMALYGFREVRTPYLEPTPLFVRAIGEATDVVEKEMYSFVYRDEAFTLRPEGTAGVARAYVEHRVHNSEPVTRWYYTGPMFRAERPQRGRYRQFYQLGAEVYGDSGPGSDAEMIDLLVGFLRAIGVNDPEVYINSLGGKGARARYRDALLGFLEPHKAQLSEDSQRRLSINPLRILDSKNPKDKELVADAPTILDVLDDDDRAHFDALRRHLDALKTPYRVDARLVRGLDYYTRTLFEIKGATDKLGAGNTLVGGGRYDHMISELGGPDVPAIGFAAGLERLLIATVAEAAEPIVDIYVSPIGDIAVSESLRIGQELRTCQLRTEVDTRLGSLKSQLRRANSLGARLLVLVGETELSEGVVQVKNLARHTQEKVNRLNVVAYVQDELRKAADEPLVVGESA